MDTQRSSAVSSLSDKLHKKLGDVYCSGLQNLAKALTYGGSCSFGGGLMVLAYQLFVWLKSGDWNNILVLDVVYPWLPKTMSAWLTNPTDWLGVAAAFSYVLNSSLAVFLVILSFQMYGLGFVVFAVFVQFSEDHRAH